MGERVFYRKSQAITYLFLGVSLSGVELLSGLVRAQGPDEIQKKVSFRADDQLILNALIQLGSQEHMPLGVVLQKADRICNQRKNVNGVNMTTSQIIKMLLDGTDETYFLKGSIIEVRPKQIFGRTATILNTRYTEYNSSMPTTMQDSGVILSSRLYGRLHPGQGYIGDILASPAAEKLPVFKLENVSVEDIADHIVSLGSKGIWIFYQPAENQQAPDGQVELSTYSYVDDNIALLTQPCSTAQ